LTIAAYALPYLKESGVLFYQGGELLFTTYHLKMRIELSQY